MTFVLTGASCDRGSCFETRYLHLTSKKNEIVAREIKTLLSKRVLEMPFENPDQILSPIFLKPKPDGTYRMTLNLKEFNKHVTYQHFKVDTSHTITCLIKPHCFMVSLDSKNAYYSVPIAERQHKFLRFEFNEVIHQYTCFLMASVVAHACSQNL